jgi:ubiquinone/menaquinone biosynthesis C-methylase UbiE
VETLSRYGAVDNVDVAPEAVAFMERAGYQVTKFDGFRLPFADESYDVVVACDVLEHIDDDVAALKEWRRVVRDGGSILLTVPAYQWLWSSHDVASHHIRRHTVRSIVSRAKAAELRVIQRSYAFFLSLPLFALFRMMDRQRKAPSSSYVALPRVINQILLKLVQLEARFLRVGRLPWGSSVIALLDKPHSRGTSV